MKSKALLAVVLLISVATLQSIAQAVPFIETAMNLYSQNRYQEAFDLIVTNAPEGTSSAAVKSAASQALTTIGESELKRQNVKNAYDCFKKALQLVPTNSTATQNYLQIKKSYDVTKLRNDGPSSVQALPAGESAGQTATSQSVNNTDIADLLKKLDTTADQLSSLQSADQQSRKENETLKSLIDQQRGMLQQIQTQQRTSPAVTVATAPVSSESQVVIQETLKLLGEVTERLAVQQEVSLNRESAGMFPDWFLFAILGSFFFIFAVIVFVALLLAARARSRRANDATLMAAYPFVSDSVQIGGASPARLMLGMGSESHGKEERSLALQESSLKRDLLKADHLNRMYEEVRNGTLTWETVRKYVSEMEIELKNSILKVVETKLEEGDLISNEAILPVLFPFLNDYDTFIREKSEKLAKVALLESRTGKSTEDSIEAEGGTFTLKNLMSIPKQLKQVLKGNDQSLMVAQISRGIAKQLGLPSSDCQNLYRAAIAHDAGYLVIDQERLSAIIAKTEITEEDLEFIQTHTIKGLSYFGELEIPEPIKTAILYHHERNDGSGYPEGLKKDEIPIYAKIIGLAETFMALMARRPHRDKVDYSQALAIIRDSRTKFDREMIDALHTVVQSSGSFK